MAESAPGIDNRITGGTFLGPVVQAGSVTLTLPKTIVPLMGTLAAPSSVFVGRGSELTALLDAIRPGQGAEGRRRIGLATGPAGVGKTELLLHAAHRALERGWFSGGVLSIDLQGYTPGLPPLTPGDALGRLLHRLGVPAEAVPAHTEDRAAAYRECLEGRAVLVLLDNAVDSAQVRPLLPPDGCAVLMSSRHRLPALDDVHRLTLGPLPLDAGCELLLTAAVPGADPGALRSHVSRIAAQCGGLPLALRVAAARVRGEGPGQFAELARWLADERERLVELDDGERTVTAAFQVSYDRLTDTQRLLFCLCGLHPGPRLGVDAAAALADMPVRDVRRLLQRLCNAHLVAADGAEHYRLHDLLHAYARTRLAADVPEDVAKAAMDRLIDYYLYTANRADRVIAPQRYRLPHEVDRPPRTTPDVGEHPAALAWFTDELPHLAAVVRAAARTSQPSRSWLLADAMRGFVFHAKAWDGWLDTLQVALTAAADAGEPRVQGILHNSMGLALIEQGRPSDAAQHYRTAEGLFAQAGDPHGVATSVENHAWVHQDAGDHHAALAEHHKALEIYQRLGARRNWAITLRGMALAEVELGRLNKAIAHLTQAWDVFRELGLDLDATMALNGLGEAHARAGATAAALRYHLLALRQSRICGSVAEEARARTGLGVVSAPDSPRRAKHHWERALLLYHTLRSPMAARIRTRLDALE